MRKAQVAVAARAEQVRLAGPWILGLVWGYSVFHHGGADLDAWRFCLLALGVLFLLQAAFWPSVSGQGRSDRVGSLWLAVVGLGFLQVLPLPAPVLSLISPGYAENHAALSAAGVEEEFLTLSLHPAATVAQVLRLSACALVFFLVRLWSSAGHRRDAWVPVYPVLAVAGCQAILGLAQYGTHPPERGVTGTYLNHNHYAGLLELALPLAMVFAATRLLRLSTYTTLPRLGNLSAASAVLLALVLFAGLIASHSRMGFVSAITALGAMAALALQRLAARRQRRWIVACVLAAAIGAFLVLPPNALVTSYGRIASMEGLAKEGRLLLWHETLDLVTAYPLLGSGLGSFESAFARYKRSMPHFRDDHAHNDYLEVLAEGGLLGLALLLALSITSLKSAWMTWQWARRREERAMALGCLGCFLSIGIHSFADFNLQIPSNGLLVAWVMGLSDGLARPAPRTHRRRRRRLKSEQKAAASQLPLPA